MRPLEIGKLVPAYCHTVTLSHILSSNPSLTAYVPLHRYAFHVDPSCSYSPGPPHRDRPLAGPTSFRQPERVKGQVEAEVAEVAEEVEDASDESAPEGEDQNGAPKYCSVWVALTDATPENSCLYFVPKSLDKGYYAEGDALGVVDLRHIVAQPLAAGGMLAFSHRVLHRASQPLAQLLAALPGGGPKDLAGGIPVPQAQDKVGFPRSRMALSFAFADPAFEQPYFDHTLYLSMGTGTGTGTDDIGGSSIPRKNSSSPRTTRKYPRRCSS
jgi:hypothetical protein